MSMVSNWIRIEEGPQEVTEVAWNRTLVIGTREDDKPAMLMFTVKGLTSDVVPVKINNSRVGEIQPHRGSEHWFTQIFTFEGDKLVEGGNNIQIDNNSGDVFEIRDLVCFFHKQV